MKRFLRAISGTSWILIALTATSVALHLVWISYPDKPAFDEAHFATYASDYIKHQFPFDIHPPLGKLIYAATISLVAGVPARDTNFLTVTKDLVKGGAKIIDNHLDYRGFPYVPLRMVAGFFGVALALAFFWFLRSIGVSTVGALLGSFFVVFENALLLETRLILLNGMYLAFGIAALALYFKQRPLPVAAGALLGLSLGTKFIGVVFFIPVLIWHISQGRKEQARFLWFVASALTFFVIVISLHGVIFSPQERLVRWQSIGMLTSLEINTPSSLAPIRTPLEHIGSILFENFIGATGYVGEKRAGADTSFTTTGNARAVSSHWYEWPFLHREMFYSVDNEGGVERKLVLWGNPVVWLGATGAMLGALFIALRFLIFRRKGDEERQKMKPLLILLSGYWGSLLPFMTVVARETFLYHYFPALLFGIGLLAYFISEKLGVRELSDFVGKGQHATATFVGLMLVVIISFLLTAPLTYGLRIM